MKKILVGPPPLALLHHDGATDWRPGEVFAYLQRVMMDSFSRG